jgi:hypothetical protein
MRNQLERPVGIILTMGKDMVKDGGGWDAFKKSILNMNKEAGGGIWLQKMRGRPNFMDYLLYCYLIYDNRIVLRVNISHYEYGGTPARIIRPNGKWDTITWGRIVLTGPVIEAPEEIPMKGFQGFRYTNQIIF